jgi:succinoglycan biosynthesis protein ExoV
VKLIYYKDPKGNFGDDLNPWLWERLVPGMVDDDPDHLLLGLGTILEPWFDKDLDPAAIKIVVGSGAGMSVPALALDPSWKVYCVRGPLTASYLGLDYRYAATDPAMCLRDLFVADKPADAGTRRVGFMPHHSSVRIWDWKKTCELAGLDYIDPHGEPIATLNQIAGLRLVLTEAMHGAIVADALRVPWFPLQINPINYVGKWHDWAASIRTPIHFKPLPFLSDPLHDSSLGALLKGGIRQAGYQLRRGSSRRQASEAVSLLEQYAAHYEPYLSSDRDLDDAIGRFHVALDQLTGDWRAGRLHVPSD